MALERRSNIGLRTEFHQKAFDTVLKGTFLDLTVSEMKQMDQRIWLVFAKGWHRPSDAPTGKRKAESVHIFVCKANEEKAEVVAFQNTQRKIAMRIRGRPGSRL
jgi:hypothetical protein